MAQPINTLAGLGRAIRDARKGRAWTQEVLAKRAFVTQATVSNFERGEGNPTLSTVLALVSAVGLDLVAVSSRGSGGSGRSEGLRALDALVDARLAEAREKGVAPRTIEEIFEAGIGSAVEDPDAAI